ncbi:MAG: adenylate/guanylate cyclase, partial [Betaproteobacteria bacterium]|nr:adenylate/guanylate cyclase [Betaproteobacteria bacterium]
MTVTGRQTILIVDDTPQNIELLSEVLGADYRIKAATSGERALKIIEAESPPDLILLDIMMPGLSGYDVCERLKANPATRAIPVIFVTAMDEVRDETKGLALGGVDYITKPIIASIVHARVKTHLTVYNQRREIEAQTRQLSEWNVMLEQRVADGIAQVERLSMLKRFFSPTVTDLILDGTAEDPLKSHRREIVVVFLDLRGFTAFTETTDPEEVMGVLHEYHCAMGELILANGGTIERFLGDGIMVVFNDPVPIPNPAAVAVRM